MSNWYWMGMTAFLVSLAVVMAFEAHEKGQCRVEAIKAGKSVEDIAKICR